MPSDHRDPARRGRWLANVPPRLARRVAACVIVLLVAVATSAVVVYLIDGNGPPDIDAPFTVTYAISGSVRSADITWYQDSGANRSSSAFVSAQALPWSKRIVVDGAAPTLTLTAMASTAGEAGSLTCTITVNGSVRSRQTLTGLDPSVACDDSESG